MRVWTAWAALGILVLTASSGAYAAPDYPRSLKSAPGRFVYDDTSYLNANSLLLFANNTGILARDLPGVFGYDDGLFYPFTNIDDIISGVNTTTVMFAAGIWIAGRINDSIRVSMSQYASEFWPGPMFAGSFDTHAVLNPDYRVYSLHADSLADNPNQSYLNWPVSQGAPLDGAGNPAIRGDQLLWTVFNDANPDQHTFLGGETEPLGVEIHQMIWGSNAPGQERVIFVQYTMFNRGSHTIDSCFITFWTDPDLGWAEDDLIGCDSADNLFFCYNGDDNDDPAMGGYGAEPPAVGVKLLRGPLIPSPGDTALFDRTVVEDHRNLEMYSIITYPTGGDPSDYNESWNVMRGLNMDGSPRINPVTTIASRFWVSGDPVNSTGWVDSSPADRIMMGTTGPFTFNPGDSQYVLFKIAVGQGTDRLSSITDLRSVLNSDSGTPTGIDERSDPALPAWCVLEQNYPNPFNPATRIRYTLPSKTTVRITVHNILGQEVATLINTTQPAGSYDIEWDGSDSRGLPVASGVYFCRMQTEHAADTRKMVLLR